MEVTFESDHISLLLNSAMSSTLNCFFIYFIATQKKKIILEAK